MLVSLTEAAAANGMAPTTLRGYCLQGRVKGAQRIGNRWAVPAGCIWITTPVRQVGRPAKRATVETVTTTKDGTPIGIVMLPVRPPPLTFDQDEPAKA